MHCSSFCSVCTASLSIQQQRVGGSSLDFCEDWTKTIAVVAKRLLQALNWLLQMQLTARGKKGREDGREREREREREKREGERVGEKDRKREKSRKRQREKG